MRGSQNARERTEAITPKTRTKQNGAARTGTHSPLSVPRHRGSNPCLPAKQLATTYTPSLLRKNTGPRTTLSGRGDSSASTARAMSPCATYRPNMLNPHPPACLRSARRASHQGVPRAPSLAGQGLVHLQTENIQVQLIVLKRPRERQAQGIVDLISNGLPFGVMNIGDEAFMGRVALEAADAQIRAIEPDPAVRASANPAVTTKRQHVELPAGSRSVFKVTGDVGGISGQKSASSSC